VYILLQPHVIKYKTDHNDNDNNTIIFVRIYSPGINKGRKVSNECGQENFFLNQKNNICFH